MAWNVSERFISVVDMVAEQGIHKKVGPFCKQSNNKVGHLVLNYISVMTMQYFKLSNYVVMIGFKFKALIFNVIFDFSLDLE